MLEGVTGLMIRSLGFDADSATKADAASDARPSVSWESEEEVEDAIICNRCGLSVPGFALVAHDRFHDIPD